MPKTGTQPVVDLRRHQTNVVGIGRSLWLRSHSTNFEVYDQMSDVTRKTEVGPIDGTPVKRMFWSIISDYDLKTGLCELVDNALDIWKSNKQKGALKIEVTLDIARQLIFITDNAGGVKQDELELLIVPGGSRNDPGAQVIGIFGVGSKRAGIALGETVKIQTRYKKEASYEIEITKSWLESVDWKLAYYEIPDTKPS